jgi:hypothetical protein
MGLNTETGAVSELNEPLLIKGTFWTCPFEGEKLTNIEETKRIIRARARGIK